MVNKETELIKQRLIEAGGRMSQDLGLGRIVGQTLIYLYLSREEGSLDEIGENIGLSKASISIAARQLERLGMIVRVWKTGDRKSYYRTADNFTRALQKGLIEYVRQKLSVVGGEIEIANEMLKEIEDTKDQDARFIIKRVNRGIELKKSAEKLLNNPIVNFLAKT
jgi:DNA-binding transcriptional regulator GbsR (MarR family)